MGLFTAITGLFKRSSDVTEEEQENESQDIIISEITYPATTATTATPFVAISTSNLIDTHITASTSGGDVITEEERCACGGSCTCKEEPEQEIVNEAAYDFHSRASSTTQAILPGLDDISAPIKQESTPTVHKIEDASILRPSSPEPVKQLKLPGFEDDPITPPKDKKKSNTKKASAKLTRKSTVKRKKK